MHSGTHPDGGLTVEVVERVPGDPGTGRGGCLLVQLRGAVTAATGRYLAEALGGLLTGGSRVIVDLAAVDEVEVVALLTLSDECAVARARGCEVVLAAPSPAVRALLGAAGMTLNRIP